MFEDQRLIGALSLLAGLFIGANWKKIKKVLPKAQKGVMELAENTKEKVIEIAETTKEAVEDTAKKVLHRSAKPARRGRKAAAAA